MRIISLTGTTQLLGKDGLPSAEIHKEVPLGLFFSTPARGIEGAATSETILVRDTAIGRVLGRVDVVLHELVCILVGVPELVIYVDLSVPQGLCKVGRVLQVLVEECRILLLHGGVLQLIRMHVMLLSTVHHHCLLRGLVDDTSVVSLVFSRHSSH